MSSRFKESLGFVKSLIEEDIYHSENEEQFIQKYVEESEIKIPKSDLLLPPDQFAQKHRFLPEPFHNGLYLNLFAAFLFIFETEIVLDEIEYDGLSFIRAEKLLDLCSLLRVNSATAMIEIDSSFSSEKKYSLAQSIYMMAMNMHDAMLSVHSFAAEDLLLENTVALTQYDQTMNRLTCKYIRSGISVLKLFHVLTLLRISPAYSDGVHQVAEMLISSLREILFNKRIIKMVVDTDTRGLSDKAHKTTRLKILFALGNSDRYCIRLDFPHEGENSIHLNMNEPKHKQSSGLPFGNKEYLRAIEICGERSVFDKLFYTQDGLHWFRRNYAILIKEIRKENETQGQALEKFYHDRAHIQLSPPGQSNLTAVSEFSEAFAEAMVDYEEICIYGRTDSEDDTLYRYAAFQDVIFELVIGIRNFYVEKRLRLGERSQAGDKADEMRENDALVKSKLCKIIDESFSQDEKLKEYAGIDTGLCDFLSKCLDRMDQVGV